MDESTAVHSVETETQILNIYTEESPSSPREWDNLGTMMCSHSRYSLGEKHSFDFKAYESREQMESALKRRFDVAVMLPLYLYDHSGITMKTTPFGDRWDSGQVGYIFVSKKKLREEYSVKRITKKLIEKATKILEGEVNMYDQYLTGDVYGFEITDKDGNHIDSCWGFYGDDYANNGIAEHVGDELAELLKK